jgi:hypothetical protein
LLIGGWLSSNSHEAWPEESARVGVVNQPVQDAVGDGWIADLRMPTVYRQLTGQHRRTPAVAVITDLQEAGTLIVAQRRHGEVIHQQHIGERDALQQPAQTAVGPRLGQGRGRAWPRTGTARCSCRNWAWSGSTCVAVALGSVLRGATDAAPPGSHCRAALKSVLPHFRCRFDKQAGAEGSDSTAHFV